jgi:hypothetical protein
MSGGKKRVSFGGMPPNVRNPDADAWVEGRVFVEQKEATKRLTIDVPVSLHKRIKSQCVMQGLVMADEIRELLDKRFPAGEGAGAS